MNIDMLRRRIDSIDKDLVRLFEKRMETIIDIARYKRENNLPILDKKREEKVLEKNMKYLTNQKYRKQAEEFFTSVMDISKEFQTLIIEEDINEKTKDKSVIGYQGIKGSYSEQALKEYFGDKVTTLNYNNFEDVFMALKEEKIKYGVLPLENSSTGGISQIYDLLRKYDLYIVGEKCIKVDHNLLAIKGTKIEDIKKVYSHPQALLQCEKFLKSNGEWELIPCANTAVSAKLVKDSKSLEVAAIGSNRSAQIYDLEILEAGINCFDNNSTRFVIIRRGLEVNKDCNKISLIVDLSHEPGALYKVLKHFADHNINMLKIESRPIEGRSWQYFFYIDIEGNIDDPNISEGINQIKTNSSFFKLLGNYKQDVVKQR